MPDHLRLPQTHKPASSPSQSEEGNTALMPPSASAGSDEESTRNGNEDASGAGTENGDLDECDNMEPLEPQDEFYPSGERKRVRSACVACHERKLRCVMLKKGGCRHCLEKDRICTPRIEKKRGRPRNSELRSRPQLYVGPGMNHLAPLGLHQSCDVSALGTMPNLASLHAAQLHQSGSHMMAMQNGMMPGAGQNFVGQQSTGSYTQQIGLAPRMLPNGQVGSILLHLNCHADSA